MRPGPLRRLRRRRAGSGARCVRPAADAARSAPRSVPALPRSAPPPEAPSPPRRRRRPLHAPRRALEMALSWNTPRPPGRLPDRSFRAVHLIIWAAPGYRSAGLMSRGRASCRIPCVSRILVIDDDQGVRETVQRMLRAAGYTVQTAESGEDGLALARGGAFDVILSDMRMTGISGIEVLRRLREQRVDSAFIVMTAFGTVDTAVEAMKLGAVDFVQKPFFRDELLMRVLAAADRRQLARQVDLLQRQIGGSDTPAALQAKLLRALESGEVRRIGENDARTVNVRFIAATNADLQAAVDSGAFRRDLFYRLNVHRIHVPPLRERPGDVGRLVNHFLARYGAPAGVTGCSSAARDALLAYDYPGNVRQLQHIVQRAVAIARGPELQTDDLPEEILPARVASEAPPEGTVAAARDRAERDMIVTTLTRHHGEIAAAARELHVSRTTLWRLMKKHQIPSGTAQSS